MVLTITISIFVPNFIRKYIDDIYTDPSLYRERSLNDFFASEHDTDIYRRFKMGAFLCAIASSTITHSIYFSNNNYAQLINKSDMILLSAINLALSSFGGILFAMPYGITAILRVISILGISSMTGLLIFLCKKYRN